jgi:nickel-dependent lactate racemase
MKLYFPYRGYEGILPVEIPDENLMGIYEPKTELETTEGEVLSKAFLNPIGAQRIQEELRGKKNILVLIDDATRQTPVHKILPYFIEELHSAGIPDSAVSILTAQGTHRKMSDLELKTKLGPFHNRFRVYQHDWHDEANLHHFGSLSDGTEVAANKLIKNSDFIIGFGSIVPHRVKGFSGGAKIAFPGVAGREIMERNQWEASVRMSETVMGIAENPMRLRMEEAALMIGFKYIVNLVSDAEGKIIGCFVGDVIKAHREGCRLSYEINAVSIPERADIVLIDSYPADRDFWQSAKGFYSGTMAVRQGGTLICVSPNPEGVADNHPNLLEIGYKPHQEIIRMVEAGEVDDIVGAAILGDMAQIIDRANCILVSPGINRKETERLGLQYANSAQEALAIAFERHGKKASVAVFRQGGHILPIVENEAIAYVSSHPQIAFHHEQ